MPRPTRLRRRRASPPRRRSPRRARSRGCGPRPRPRCRSPSSRRPGWRSGRSHGEGALEVGKAVDSDEELVCQEKLDAGQTGPPGRRATITPGLGLRRAARPSDQAVRAARSLPALASPRETGRSPMHRSRFVAFVIDCKTEDLDVAARFWSGALGREPERTDPDSPSYRALKGRPSEPLMLLQKVDHESRVHLDIESDDVDAEAARLERLGAKKLGRVETWWVMEAPTGHRFCVVRPQRGPLGDDANRWP